MDREELERKQRVADQMVTQYSVLRDRYALRATLLTLSILLSSVILCTLTFFPDAVAAIGVNATAVTILLGAFSSLVLFASVAELCLNWREKSERFGEAADRLARVKSRVREILSCEESPRASDIVDVCKKYDEALDGLPKISDRQFVSLKAYHLRKVALSKLCDETVGCPVFILRLLLWWRGIRSVAHRTKQSRENRR